MDELKITIHPDDVSEEDLFTVEDYWMLDVYDNVTKIRTTWQFETSDELLDYMNFLKR